MLKSLLSAEIKKWFEKSAMLELYASNLYKFMANQLQRMGMFGCQEFFLKESKEEIKHYQKLVDYVNDMGDVLGVQAIERIDEDIIDIEKALLIAYETELSLMHHYQEFYEKAEEDGDCITSTFLIEFMQIQRRSVGEYGDLISRLSLNKQDIFEFDHFVKKLANE